MSYFLASKVIIERESALLVNQHHHLRGLATDHSNMSKFDRLDDPNHVEISCVLKEIYEDIIKPQQTGCEVLFDCQSALLEWVTFITVSSTYDLSSSSVVFVHSLGCNNLEAWTHGETYWPKALLPVDLPYARVIAYHYQTNFTSFLHNQTVMHDLAITFLLALLKIRSILPSNNLVCKVVF
jgi:hypothetical protein